MVSSGKVRKQPRLSANQLAEYLEANSQRRRSVLKEAKYPPVIPSVYYDEPKKIITQFYLKGMDEAYLIQSIDKYKAKDVISEPQEKQKYNCTKMLEAVLKEKLSPLAPYTLLREAQRSSLLEISGVDISVCPDLILKRESRNGVINVGAVKFLFSKNGGLSLKGQAVVNVLLYEYISTFLLEDGEVSNKKYCFSFDILKQEIGSCPATSKRLFSEIEAACEEIAILWDSI